jgi:hypothetical protein
VNRGKKEGEEDADCTSRGVTRGEKGRRGEEGAGVWERSGRGMRVRWRWGGSRHGASKEERPPGGQATAGGVYAEGDRPMPDRWIKGGFEDSRRSRTASWGREGERSRRGTRP